MGYFDNLPDENTGSTTTATKKTAPTKGSSFFDDLPDESPVAPITPEVTPKKNVPDAYTPPVAKKLTYKDPGYYDSEDFKNDVIAKYDAAPDKQKLKNTLTNTELAVLNEKRPENKNYSNPSIYDASVKVKPIGFDEKQANKIKAVEIVDKAIADKKLPENIPSWDELLAVRNNTVKQIQEDNAKFYNADGSTKGNVVDAFEGGVIKAPDSLPQRAVNQTVGKAIEYYKEDVTPAVKTISDAWDGVWTYSNGTVKRLDNAQSFLKGSAGLVNLIFSPISFGARQIGTDNPDDLSQAGNVINKVISLPFEATKGVVKTGAILIGMDKESADDFGTVIAAILPLLKIKGKEVTTKELSTIVNKTNQTFTKIRDLDPNAKLLWREGARELHPDVTGLPYTYMARFNDAAAKGDLQGMKNVLKEAKDYQVKNPQVKPQNPAYTDTTLMREEAAKGNENAIIRNGNYQEAVKTTDVTIKDTAGNPVAKIETVGYEDGKVAVRTTVTDTSNNSVSTQFQGEYPTKEAAVKAGAVQTQMILENNVSKTVVSDLAEVKAQLEEIKNASSARIAQIGIQARGQKIETKPTEKVTAKETAKTEAPKELQEKTSTMQLSEGPYKGQFQVTIVEGANKGKFAIGKTEESAMMKLEDVKVWKAVTREPTVPAKAQEVSNKNTETKPVSEPKKEAKEQKPSNKNSEKLRKVADTLREKSEESLNQNRNDNTARRARMADSARDSARADLEFANTLTKLADAIDKGEVKYLTTIGSKADLARLERVYRIAENKAARELGKAEKDLTTAEIAKYVDTNRMRVYLSRSDVEAVSPSSYGKATKAGVDLKGFLKAAQGDWITISKWEKEIEYTVKNAESIFGRNAFSIRGMGEELTTYKALEKLQGSSSYADIFSELKLIKEGAKVVETPAEILKRKERDLVQRTQIEGFFPTPERIVERMIEDAGIEKGMTVLEPSAGIGSIADKIRESGIEPDVGEYAPSLSQHLTEKGYNVVSSDFMDLPKSKKYDRIIMNPPFERLQDVDHVTKAYDHLNDGGRVVAIMGESAFFNSTKKAVEFRDWLDKVGGYSEKLPEGTFKESLRYTGVATRIVTIEKVGNRDIIDAVNKGEDLTFLSKRKPKGSIGWLNSTGGDRGIAQFENRAGEQTAEAFKLSQRVQKVIDDMETRFTKYVAPGSQGTFYSKSKNIALRSVNEVAVVQHELSHFVDNALGITDALLSPVRTTINGRNVYSSVTKPTRDLLTKIYVDTYPGARKTDALYTRVKEGYAMTQQLWLETPEKLMKEYPELYKQYVENAPELQKKLNTAMEEIVRDYQDLSARDRINAVKSRALNPTNPEKFLTVKERIEEYMVDAITRFEKLDKLAGNMGTRNSVSDLLYANQNVLMRVLKNLTEPGEGFWSFNKFGELEKVSDNNYSGLIADLGKQGKLDEFSDYLIARDQYYNWQRLDVKKAELKELQKGFMETLEKGQTLADLPKEMLEILKERAKEVVDYENIMKINSTILSREDVTKVATENAEFYKSYAEQFDKFNRSDLKAMEASGMISAERLSELSQLEGYAPMKRLMQDGLIGQENILPGSGKGTKAWKASSLKQRTGGTHDIIDPLISYAANHREVMLKTYKQFIMNKLYDTIVQFPAFSQEVSFRTINIDGKVSRILGDGTKLEDAPNVILKMTDGKPKAVAINEGFAKPLEMIFKPTERGGLEKFVVGSARRFSQGTTGLYPLFALTNLTRDQQSALVNTQNAYNPGAFPKYAGITASIMLKDKVSDLQYKKIIGPAMKRIADMLPNMESKDAQYVREYMALGGEYNTTLNFNEMPGEKLLEAMAKEKSGLKKFGDFLGTGLDLAAMPANISEIATRVQEYAKARESGKGQWAAMEYAGKVSAPFHHKGLIAKNAFARASINSIPYLNAALQGLAQYVKTGTRDKAGFGRASAAAIITGAAALYIVLNAIENSDDKTKEAFIQLDAGSLGLYLYYPLGNGEFTKIPISQQNGWLGALMTMVVADKKYGANYSTKEYLDAMTVGFPDQIKLFDQEKVLLSVVPQILKPSLEVIFNKKTFPSVRDLESQAQKMQLPQFRATPNTSTFAKEFAKSDVGLKVGLSPIQIDNLLEGYLGRAVGYLTGKPSAYDPKSPFKQPEYFTSGRIIQKFYDEFGQDGKLAQTMTSIKKGDLKSTPEQDLINYTKNKRASAVLDLLKDLKEQETNTPEFNATRKQIWEGVTKLLYEFDPSSITADEKKGFATKIEAADWKIEQSDIVETYVKKYQDATDNFKRTRLEKELKAEIQGDSKTMTDSQKNHYEATVQKLRKAWAASEDPFVGELSGLKLNADKAKKLVEKRDEMIASGKTQEDFMAYMRDLIKKKVVSEDLMGKVNRLMKQ